MSRPHVVGIDRLPTRRHAATAKGDMNCKSCRKRKIKCDRVKPVCEACRLFECDCLYDAVPKKRGPKTDVLEALLKRVNGLEQRLKDDRKSSDGASTDCDGVPAAASASSSSSSQKPFEENVAKSRPDASAEPPRVDGTQHDATTTSHPLSPPLPPPTLTDALIATYFTRIHGQPFYILDEAATRQRLKNGQLPHFLRNALFALSARYALHLFDGGLPTAAARSNDFAAQARAEIDVDEPTIEHVQALLLLSLAAFQQGQGKRSYMLLSHVMSMARALQLHQELPASMRVSAPEREGRRKLFWTAWMLSQFAMAGSQRPPLIPDDFIQLKLPAWTPSGARAPVDAPYFLNGSGVPGMGGGLGVGQSSEAVLIDIIRILGSANRYLASGGVKGDSHFPWHSQSTLNKIRADLELFAVTHHERFSSVELLFNQPDRTTLVLIKLVFHLVHCLLYRPFLPVDLGELSGTAQHQPWQNQAMELCFSHANAICELVELGNTVMMDWPAFVSYCVCTAGTVHVHGAHYMAKQGTIFGSSSEFFNRELSQLNAMCLIWACAHRQRETLRTVYAAHSQLVRSLASSPTRFAPVFQTEDFFDRYPGVFIDGAHISLVDIDFSGMPSEEAHSLRSTETAAATALWNSQKRATESTSPSKGVTNQTDLTLDDREAKRSRIELAPNPYPTPATDPIGEPPLQRHTSDSAIPRLQPQQQQQPPISLTPLPPRLQHAPSAPTILQHADAIPQSNTNSATNLSQPRPSLVPAPAATPTLPASDFLSQQSWTPSALSPSSTGFTFNQMPQALNLAIPPLLIRNNNSNYPPHVDWTAGYAFNNDNNNMLPNHAAARGLNDQQAPLSASIDGSHMGEPGAGGGMGGGAGEKDKDPFLSFLEHWAQRDGSADLANGFTGDFGSFGSGVGGGSGNGGGASGEG